MLTSPAFDPDLLRRHDRPGPRYTSYPTAPQFHAGFGELQLREAAASSNGDPIPRRLSLYVPFCESPCFYCGCNRVITRDKARGDAYLARLFREIDLASQLFDRDREVIQVHFGETLDTIARHFRIADAHDRDISIELDPRHVDASDIAALAQCGFNRAS